MISTLYGRLPGLTIYPEVDMQVTPGGRTDVCKVRGEALGQRINVQVTLDLNTGELLLMSPDGFVGSFRMGDLVTAHVQQQLARATRERQAAEGGAHAAPH